ncbi:MAG: OmpA family protein [Gemmatimonadota bacterium]|nr:OmpA family protein [Gemmatimonadota bacterium]
MIRIPHMAAFAVTLIAVAACSKTPPPAAAPAPAPMINQDSINAANAARARADSIARADAARRDADARARADADRIAAERSGAVAAMRATLAQAIYFEYDSDALSDDARAKLDAKLAIMTANTGLRLRVAGSTDERGSDEYNIALGQRRAAAAKRYLSQHGIADDRIDIISLGEEKPVATGHDESSWSQNRRDEFEITAGGDQLMPPRPR